MTLLEGYNNITGLTQTDTDNAKTGYALACKDVYDTFEELHFTEYNELKEVVDQAEEEGRL